MENQLSERIENLQTEVEILKHDVVGLEHRLVQVVRNAYWALTQPRGWTPAKRLEAGAALIRYFLAGRATLILGVSLGGLLALHASFILTEQNRKLDLQNHLAVVASEIAEAQRNSQFAQLIPPLLSDVVNSRNRDTSLSTSQKKPTEITDSKNVYVRVAILTQTFQPYRWIDKRISADALLSPKGNGPLFDFLQSLRQIYNSGFGASALELGESGVSLELPLLTAERYSPERGLILVNLFAEKIPIKGLSQYNVTFERSYAPGARLDGIDLRGMTGPSLSKPLDFRGSYFRGATFTRSKIGEALFDGSDFQQVNMSGADATEAQWNNVNLEGADLSYTNLQGASLTGANFQSTSMKAANFSNANLQNAKGLTPAQLSTACISLRTTRLPPDSVPKNYIAPKECCQIWSNSTSSFTLSPNGTCVASE